MIRQRINDLGNITPNETRKNSVIHNKNSVCNKNSTNFATTTTTITTTTTTTITTYQSGWE